MKLVKIDNLTYVDPESIGAIEDGRFGTNIYLTGSDKPIETLAEIGKVLDAVCGSEERSVKCEDTNYSIIIGSDNAEVKMIATKSDVLSLLNELKTDETLTIKRSK